MRGSILSTVLLGGAAFAFAATTPAIGKPDGGGGEKRGNPSAERQGGGGGKADRGSNQQQERGGGPRVQADYARGNVDTGRERRNEQAQRDRGRPDKSAVRPDRAPDSGRPGLASDRGRAAITSPAIREVGPAFAAGRPAPIKGCPPGLAKKFNGCTPPGLARANAVPWTADWWGYRDDGYRYYDGYLLRYAGPSLIGYIPLLGGALFIGEPWPEYYEVAPVPRYWADYYDLGPDYRYYDDTFYALDPDTDRIVAVSGFLTGDDFIVGRRLPVGYDIYNVPWDYRDRYVDGPDVIYRYADGYIYRVDPTTMLILAAIQLLT